MKCSSNFRSRQCIFRLQDLRYPDPAIFSILQHQEFFQKFCGSVVVIIRSHKICLRILSAGFEESLHISAERISDRYYLIYRCQCEVARAFLRGIRSFAHFHFLCKCLLMFHSFSTEFRFTSVTGSSTSRCGYSSPSSIHFSRISTAFCVFFCTSCFMVVSLGVAYCA